MSLRSNLERIDIGNWKNSQVQIRPIKTEADLIYAIFQCRLNEAQKDLVNPAGFSIGRAYLSREDHYPCVICNENAEPIGFISFSKWVGAEQAYSWSYYIDKDYQGKGYGRAAAQLAIHILKTAFPRKSIKLSTEVCNLKAQGLYTSLGFVQAAELDGDDLVFVL